MPKRKVQRTLEEEKEFHRQRCERKAENQRRRRQITKTIANTSKTTKKVNNTIIYVTDKIEENPSTSAHQVITVTGVIHDNRVIKVNNDIIEINSTISKQDSISTTVLRAEYQSQYRSRKKNQTRLNINSMMSIDNVAEFYIGSMNVSCVHCNAKHFAAEKISNKGNSFHDCCNHGKVYLQPLPEFPHFLKSLYEENHEKSNQFFNYIRTYNSSFSFASFNANVVNFSGRRPGPYCFKIQGQIYYQINTALYAAENENPTHGQLFIIDSSEAINCCLQQTSNLDLEIVRNLKCMMQECNIFAQSYQMMGEELENQRQIGIESGELFSELQLLFTLKPGMDRRRYNIQRTNEVAAVFSTTADGDIPESYVIIRNKNTKILQKVSSMDPNVEPWIYPLFFPYGT